MSDRNIPQHRLSIAIIIIFLLYSSCATVSPTDTSKNALDWPGTYKCDSMTIILKENMTYLARVNNIEIRSSFVWDANGRTVRLRHIRQYTPCTRFLVGEDRLIPMKNKRKKDKEGYILIKQ